MEETKKKKIDIDSRPVFWSRFVLWVCFSIVAPVLFISFRYGLFKAVSNVSLSGWGTLVGLIIFVFVVVLLRSILKSTEYAYYKQIIKGVLYLIAPMFLVTWCLYISKDTIERLIQTLGFCTLSWAVAIAINPMPRWTYIKSKGETANMVEMILAKREEKK